MRISTANAFDNGIDTLSRRQAEMTALQDQLTSGKRISRASDDPAAAARAERAIASVGRSETSQRAVDASKVLMTQTESNLGDAGTLLQRARELVVSAGNASFSDADRTSVANELQSLRDQLFAVANQSDGAGTYLFGGQGATQQPFVDTPTGVQYVAATGQTVTENGTALPLTTDGQAAWLTARTGNGVFVTSAAATVKNATIDNGRVADPSALTGADYTLQFSVAGGATTYAVLKNGLATAVTAAPYVSGQAITVDGMTISVSGTPATGDQFQIAPSTPTLGVFAVLDQTIAALKLPGRTGAQIAQGNADSLRDVDAVLGNLQSARSAAGQVLNRIDSETNRLDSQKLASTTERSNAEDVDMVHAISDFQNKQSGYDAALKSYAMVQRLSLFQYVNGG
ncbi:MAG TPA: flagellar hook-associated protein FlgL [Caldimonas sp.]|jgi:flagellar hook-associated protein 3 FlgL|nr:flagellar hook-associated protein FlgL [Caldimonas sp.]HEV7575688.1 flagellar hook-associated protein FlgL [Caldimonas sp.]